MVQVPKPKCRNWFSPEPRSGHRLLAVPVPEPESQNRFSAVPVPELKTGSHFPTVFVLDPKSGNWLLALPVQEPKIRFPEPVPASVPRFGSGSQI